MSVQAVIRSIAVPCVFIPPMLFGCQSSIPKGALAMSETTLEQRQLQTRRFDTTDESRILTASAGLLQDLGFSIDASESKLGLLVGSKERDATEGGQVAGAVAMALLFGVRTEVDSHQRIRASVVTHPNPGQVAVRVTFQRVVWNSANRISKLELIDDAEIYQEFFEKLSKAVFLEAHQI